MRYTSGGNGSRGQPKPKKPDDRSGLEEMQSKLKGTYGNLSKFAECFGEFISQRFEVTVSGDRFFAN